jgi:hypothetical protein
VRPMQTGQARLRPIAPCIRPLKVAPAEDLGMAEIADRFYGALKPGVVIGPGAHVVRAQR